MLARAVSVTDPLSPAMVVYSESAKHSTNSWAESAGPVRRGRHTQSMGRDEAGEATTLQRRWERARSSWQEERPLIAVKAARRFRTLFHSHWECGEVTARD